MGCISSKLIRKEIEQENLCRNGDFAHHVVSLTSSTYGLLKLDKDQRQQKPEVQPCAVEEPAAVKTNSTSPLREAPPSEIINAWELMEGLEEQAPPSAFQARKSPKSTIFSRGFHDFGGRSPLKLLNQMGSPRKLKKFLGKENSENSPKTTTKLECGNLRGGSTRKPSPRLWASIKGSPNVKRCNSLRIDSCPVSSKRSLSPFFDPELVASLEKEVSEEEEQIKKMISTSSRNSQDSNTILESYVEKSPPGSKNSVIIYTTTLRSIRKTFEECNAVRSIIESHKVRMFERDISMHSAFREELRGVMGSKEVKVPVVFVKGRLIGGASEMMKLDEEGKLEVLLGGIPKAAEAGCGGCGGIRFVMCVECDGSCRILGEDGKKSLKCRECNENGLIQCPICC